MSDLYRLISIGASHYCEKARWALDRLHVPYLEDAHFPMFHWRATYGVGAGRTVPVLVAGERVLGDSTDILEYLDTAHHGAFYPEAHAARVRALEERFDEALGPATRRIAYFHLLPEGKLVRQGMGQAVSRLEYTLFPFVFPLGKHLLRYGLKINAAGVERSEKKVEEVFAEVERLIADGRRYLVGDAFTAADLTFAAMASPLLAPPEHGGIRLPLADYPQGLRQEVSRWREREAGRFALRLYREERYL